jgi:sugar/nucleoside kinase (ribokinase family)
MADGELLSEMQAAGVRTHVVSAPETTELDVVYPTGDVEHRHIYRRKFAGAFRPEDLGDLDARCVHLAGNTDGEFPPDMVRQLRKPGRLLSVDLQGYVRQCNRDSGEIIFRDVPAKRDIISCMDVTKLDVVEAEVLTGMKDPEKALAVMAGWGCPEIVLTRTRGVLGCFDGRVCQVSFTNHGHAGRNGRGDSTFAGYLSWRIDHSPEESLRFAAALASIKLEKRGPFSGTIQDVLARM